MKLCRSYGAKLLTSCSYPVYSIYQYTSILTSKEPRATNHPANSHWGTKPLCLLFFWQVCWDLHQRKKWWFERRQKAKSHFAALPALPLKNRTDDYDKGCEVNRMAVEDLGQNCVDQLTILPISVGSRVDRTLITTRIEGSCWHWRTLLFLVHCYIVDKGFVSLQSLFLRGYEFGHHR